MKKRKKMNTVNLSPEIRLILLLKSKQFFRAGIGNFSLKRPESNSSVFCRPRTFSVYFSAYLFLFFFKDNTLKTFKAFLAHTCPKTDSGLNYTYG